MSTNNIRQINSEQISTNESKKDDLDILTKFIKQIERESEVKSRTIDYSLNKIYIWPLPNPININTIIFKIKHNNKNNPDVINKCYNTVLVLKKDC